MQRFPFILLSWFLCLQIFLAVPAACDPVPEKNDEPAASSETSLFNSENEEKKKIIAEIVEKANAELVRLHTELLEKHELAAPWRKRWEESRNHIKKIQADAQKKAQEFESSRDLLLLVGNHERELNQILPSVNTYKEKGWPDCLEAVNSRLSRILRTIEEENRPLNEIHAQTEDLLKETQNLASSSSSIRNEDAEYLNYKKDLTETQTYLEKEFQRQTNDLSSCVSLISEIERIQEDIRQSLPELWKAYYTPPILHWLTRDAWQKLSLQLTIFGKSYEVRRAIEFPTETKGWTNLALRSVIFIVLSGILLFILSRQAWIGIDKPIVRHCFRVSLPVVCTGLWLLILSFSPDGEHYRLFLAVGNLFVIAGQMLLAWDLRSLSEEDIPLQKSPLLRLYPLTCIAYILLYLPLVKSLLFLIWLTCVVSVLVWRHFWPPLSIGSLTLEKNIRTADGVVLWLCLILTLMGMAHYSIILYLVCVSTSLAIELCQGGIDRINYLNENQPSDGVRAILANILVSLAAPIILLLAITSVLLWVVTLPGGMVLIREYLFKNVSIGSTEFNFIHVLLIISSFFLTKAIVSSGSRYISRIFTNRENNIDTTLVAPAQTAFTYLTWILFAFFVMHLLDIDFKNAAMVMTGLSVGIGMGLQNIVNNFFSGLLLIFGRMLQVGDVIEVGGVSGKVSRISVRHTLVQTFDNAFIYIPNSEFISGHLVNWSRNDSTVRANVSVGVAYGTDTDLVIRTMQAIVNRQDNVLRYPEPSVVFQNFGDSTLEFTVYFWVKSFSDKIRTCNDVRLQIDREFQKKNIEIAFPQLDVHLARPLPPRRPVRTRTKAAPPFPRKRRRDVPADSGATV